MVPARRGLAVGDDMSSDYVMALIRSASAVMDVVARVIVEQVVFRAAVLPLQTNTA